ncbi:hypothetical protein GLOIN_2v1550616 [Rhizophagus irregularis DAOM 181602=DAOM 197198]|uniref:Uncharacterized protein n=1 Tax=Rhizophagus irregularis (strain DAOM 181602 / DAOM 197198 / MUCL 43194) TaxID=747089 RepID=A0A2P4QHD5_RHIID|nr:hypothetical protein GLOIN_2v1550616 [Rhizophagus irregularis DAOM 181602=DAOM 197198]POG77034.1 hypothetical protein GLOIN_2v1550616 [Rhizophagus irregularis DAOM 181602=DAOM 197198]GET64073.1 hypothetical protein GLOIN_2v1550616 [Rhizophagus irregularis DAOM 181602=DAOM 197198]|eukprot:XP_025183900.1 hypothetical protein GLOIN_2v1550616 [Rhizophagus irregularis DAOM 181602=DAOM 197198]
MVNNVLYILGYIPGIYRIYIMYLYVIYIFYDIYHAITDKCYKPLISPSLGVTLPLYIFFGALYKSIQNILSKI